MKMLYRGAVVLPLAFLLSNMGAAPVWASADEEQGMAKVAILEVPWTELAGQNPNPYFSETEGAELSTETLAAWWHVFGDDTLNKLVELSLRQSPDLDAARSKVNQSRASLGISKANLLPWFDATGSWSRTKTSDNSPYTGLSGVHTDVQLGVDASWEIDVFGRQRENVRAESAALQAAQADLYGAWVSLSAETALNYISLRTLQEELAIVEEQAGIQADAKELLEYRLEAGLEEELPVLQSDYTLKQTQAEIPLLKTSIEETMNRLEILTGSVPGSLHYMLQEPTALPEVRTELYGTIPAETLRQRPDIQAAERQLAAQMARTKSARKDWLPRFSLAGTLGFESASTGSLLSKGGFGFSILPQITLPLFHGGAIRRNVELQSEKEKEYYAQYEKTVLTAAGEVRNALTASYQERERQEKLRLGRDAAESAAEAAWISYESGLGDYQDVLDARRNVLTLQDAYAQSRGQELSHMVQLFKALGGGWQAMDEEEARLANEAAAKDKD